MGPHCICNSLKEHCCISKMYYDLNWKTYLYCLHRPVQSWVPKALTWSSPLRTLQSLHSGPNCIQLGLRTSALFSTLCMDINMTCNSQHLLQALSTLWLDVSTLRAEESQQTSALSPTARMQKNGIWCPANLNNVMVLTVVQTVGLLSTNQLKLLILFTALRKQCNLFHESYAVFNKALQICKMGWEAVLTCLMWVGVFAWYACSNLFQRMGTLHVRHKN